jgi:putative transposase
VKALPAKGRAAAGSFKLISVTEFTYYLWLEGFEELKSDQVKGLKELEEENVRLERAVSDLTLGKIIL